MPDLSQLHIDAALTAFSVAIDPEENFVAEEIAPVIPSDRQSDKYFIESRDQQRARDDSARPMTVANDVDWKESNDVFFCDGHKLRVGIPDDWRRGSDRAISIDLAAINNTVRPIRINQEIALKNLLVAGATTVDLNAAGLRLDDSNIDPVKTIRQYQRAVHKGCGHPPNTLMLSKQAVDKVTVNPQLTGRFTGVPMSEDPSLSFDHLKRLFGVKKIIVGDATYLTSVEGEADAGDYIWGTYAALFYQPPAPGLRVMSWANTFVWNLIRGLGVTGPVPEEAKEALGAGLMVRRYRVEEREADYIEPKYYYGQKLIYASAGVLFSNSVVAD